jgi:hypothetical protein
MLQRVSSLRKIGRVVSLAVATIAVSSLANQNLHTQNLLTKGFVKPFWSLSPIAFCEEQSNEVVEESVIDAEQVLLEVEKIEEDNIEPIMVEAGSDEEEAEWEAEKEKCSFCRHFMLSPCRPQFSLWSKCVDKAKLLDKDFILGCKHYTRALMSCTDAHSDYFALPAQEEESDKPLEINDSLGNSEVAQDES